MSHIERHIACLNIDTSLIEGLKQTISMITNRPVYFQDITTKDDVQGDDYDLLLTHDQSITSSTTPILYLKNSPVRVGFILDQIEKMICHDHYDDVMVWNDYTLNWTEMTLVHQEKTISLTERERTIIAELIKAQNKGLGREELLSRVWNYRADLETHTLETHIYRLRQKLESNPDQPQFLKTINGGYCLV